MANRFLDPVSAPAPLPGRRDLTFIDQLFQRAAEGPFRNFRSHPPPDVALCLRDKCEGDAFVDGYVTFNPSATVSSSNQTIPNTYSSQTAAVNFAPSWDDLHPRNIGKMHSALLDNDTFVIQWSRMSFNSGSNNANPQDLNFQLVLHRSGAFEYRYGTMANHPTYQSTQCHPSDCSNEVRGSSATIGYQYGGCALNLFWTQLDVRLSGAAAFMEGRLPLFVWSMVGDQRLE